jgi:hypothetical protein
MYISPTPGSFRRVMSTTVIGQVSRRLSQAWQMMPRGQSLPESAWRPRHAGIVLLLWLHAVGLLAFGLATGRTAAAASVARIASGSGIPSITTAV